jgi:glucokinase
MTHDASALRGAARGRDSSTGSSHQPIAPDAGPVVGWDPASEPPAGPVLALDLGGTHLRTAVVTPDGTIHGRRHARTPPQPAEAIMAAAIASLEASRAGYDTSQPFMGLGVSAPGPLDPQRGILIDPPNMDAGFRGFAMAERLREALGLPSFLERDTHVAALAEARFGAARGLTDFVYLTISTGVGGAIVSAGRLLTGPDGVAGELGHLPVEMDGPVCGCGARGHFERLSSGSGMARSAREELADGTATPLLRELAERVGAERIEGGHLAELEARGDQRSSAILERGRRAFAAAVVGIVDVFNPQRVIVGGGVTLAQGERLLGPAREAVRRHAFRVQAARAEIVAAELGDDVGLVGALPLVLAGLAVDGRGSARARPVSFEAARETRRHTTSQATAATAR